MAKDPLALCSHLAANQYGLFSLDQALTKGCSTQSLSRAVRRGFLTRPLPRVLSYAGAPRTWPAEVKAATLWAGADSAACRVTAAILHGLLDDRRDLYPIHVVALRPLRPPKPEIAVHRYDQHLLDERVVTASIPVTSVRRTLLDLCGTKHPMREKAVDRALRLRLASLPELSLFYEEEWLRGRRGIAILRELLIDRDPNLAATQSELEALMTNVIRDYGLPAAVPQFSVQVRDGSVLHPDFAYPEAKIAIECDGYAWHMDRDSFESDRIRDLELQAVGWIVLRFTWAQLKQKPWYCATQIRQHLKTRLPSSTWVSPSDTGVGLDAASVPSSTWVSPSDTGVGLGDGGAGRVT